MIAQATKSRSMKSSGLRFSGQNLTWHPLEGGQTILFAFCPSPMLFVYKSRLNTAVNMGDSNGKDSRRNLAVEAAIIWAGL
jgi:hypothetical protein